MPKLITRQPKRLFAFGCSFVNYCWTTWPEIVAEDLDIDYYNLGAPAAGNEFIFNRLMQADRVYNINQDDLVMICWSSIFRKDKCRNGQWDIPGNVFMQDEFPYDYIKKYYTDEYAVALHNFAYIKASRTLLELKGCQWHFLQMADLSMYKSPLLADEIKYMQPDFYKVLWNDDTDEKEKFENQTYGFFDGHPTPNEALKYLSTVFEHNWKPETVEKVNLNDEELHQLRIKHTGLKFEPYVKHLKNPLLASNII